ncbi:MAG TPA: DUF6199 family natural product biosynthesis protein [Pirellulales bacterium]|nr:DUF6199 family natural product biosynthesis protein [Pirellulales bacterium]
MDEFIPFFGSAAMIFAGLFGLARPAVMWQLEENLSNDAIEPTAEALRKVRITCAVLLALGLIALAVCLFGEPAEDAGLI